MTSFRIEHPEEWIGLPETFPNERWTRPQDWADDLLGELGELWGAAPGTQAQAMREYLLAVQASTAERGALRTFVTVDGWEGPASIADAVVVPGWALDGKTVEDLANEPLGAIEPPDVEVVETEGGITAYATTRYSRAGEPHPGVIARLDVLVPVNDGAVRVHTAQRDLVRFERIRPAVIALARGVTIDA